MAVEAKAVFRVEATGDNLHFQWQKNRTDLSDGGRYCDTDTDTLCIVEVEKDDKGRYRCIVENSVGKQFSKEASLTVGKLIILCITGDVFEKIVNMQNIAVIFISISLADFVVYFCRICPTHC